MRTWPLVNLGEILQPSRKVTAGELDAPILSITMKDGLVEQNDRFKKRIASVDTSTYKVVRRNQLVVGFPIDEGVLDFQRNFDKALVSPAYGIWDLTIEDVELEYLRLFLRSPRAISIYRSRLQGTTARRRSLPNKVFQEIEIPLPPLNEQKRIAEILGRAQRAIDAVQKLRLEVYNFKVASLKYVFGSAFDKCQPLSTVASVQSGITKGRKIKDNLTLTSVPYMAVSNVKAGYLDLTTIKEIAASASEIDRFRLEDGDILLTEGGDPDKLGRGTIWRGEVPQAIHQNHIFRVRISKTSCFTPQALMAVLESRESKAYFLRSAKQTTGIASINKTQLSATPIPVLTKLKVEEATELWRSTEHIIDLYGQKLALLEELQRSLSARAFDGRL